MNQFLIRIIGLAAAFAIAPALAEDLTAGKTPAQLFRSDCSTCHHSTSGLVKERRDIGSLTAFLREHYTTKSDSAAALAAYVSGFAPGARTRGSSDADRPHIRGDTDAPRPPHGLPASAQVSEPADPVSQLRNFLSPGVRSEGANEPAAKPKVRKRRTVDTAGARTNAGAPAATAPAAGPPKPPQPEPGKSPEPPGDPK